MALTVNQERLLIELVHQKIGDGDASLRDILVQLANANEAQVVTRLKQYASEQAAVLNSDIANLDAAVRPNAVSTRDFYATEAL